MKPDHRRGDVPWPPRAARCRTCLGSGYVERPDIKEGFHMYRTGYTSCDHCRGGGLEALPFSEVL